MYPTAQHRIILVDADDDSREVMVRRLTAQGYAVEAFGDPAKGADLALSSPPCALIADLWMPSISGVQLCRLLRAEPATASVPVILRGQSDDPRSRFWAERAGASAYVVKGRIRELVKALANAAAAAEKSNEFFLQLSGGSLDIRERIARHLDQALFDSVIAAEVRALASCGSFESLFDAFSQFLPQVINYRWMALLTQDGKQFALHHHPSDAATAEPRARELLGVPEDLSVLRIEDEDARGDAAAGEPMLFTIPFGAAQIGKLLLVPSEAEGASTGIAKLVAQELGGPLRMASLMDESQRLATTDPLTGLSNRRALLEALKIEIAHARRHGSPLSFVLLDVDHFKSVNDVHGHPTGDQVLAAIGALLRRELRIPDVPARWGGEEFVVLLKQTDGVGALHAAERIRKAVQALEISAADKRIPVTVSIGVTEFKASDTAELLVDRADRAMYRAKTGGRNRVELGSPQGADDQPNGATTNSDPTSIAPHKRSERVCSLPPGALADPGGSS